MSILLESRPPAVSVRAGCAALALSRASYYRYSSHQTAVEVAANDAVSDDVPAAGDPAMVAETTAIVAAAVTVRAVPDNALSAAEQE